MYEYRAFVLRVVDGDTVHMEVDLGFDVRRRDSFRLAGINAPEMSTEEGPLAKAHLIKLLATGPITVKTVKDHKEKYGRYLAVLYAGDVDLNARMIADGHAVAYKGGHR